MSNSAPDVARIWEVMLDDPAPPLPPAMDALAAARGSARRRTMFTAAGAGTGAVAVIAAVATGVALGGGGGGGTPGPPAPVLAPPAATAGPSQPPPLPLAPGKDAAHAHGARNNEILMAAVPPGHTGVPQRASTDSFASTWQVRSTVEYVSTVTVVITTGQADGAVSLTIRGGMTGLGTDLCAPEFAEYLSVGSAGCDLVTIGGVPARVFATHDEDRGDVSTAVRLLDGGYVFVQAEQGIPAYHADGDVPPDGSARPLDGSHSILGGWPALPAVPLTPAQVAAIAADPAVLP